MTPEQIKELKDTVNNPSYKLYLWKDAFKEYNADTTKNPKKIGMHCRQCYYKVLRYFTG